MGGAGPVAAGGTSEEEYAAASGVTAAAATASSDRRARRGIRSSPPHACSRVSSTTSTMSAGMKNTHGTSTCPMVSPRIASTASAATT
jgi:hypothetical protein